MTRTQVGDGTSALAVFLEDYGDLFGLVGFVAGLATHIDHASTAAAGYFAKYGDERKREEAERTLASGGTAMKALQQQHAALLNQLLLQRAVDNFLAYVADLLKCLRSSEVVKLEEALDFPTMEEFITFLAERKVDRLAYRSLENVTTDLERTLGFALLPKEADLAHAVRLVATRNLIAHNRAIVNPKFTRQIPNTEYAIGEKLWLGGPDLLADLRFLQAAACDIDGRAALHFGLPRKSLTPHPFFIP
jgi:hypothetical protein